MTLSERLSEYVRAAFSGTWVRSHEHDEAVHEIARLCRGNGWTLATWDIDRGITLNGNNAETAAMPAANDPLSAIKALPALATTDGTAVLVLRNFHRFVGSAEIVQALDTAISRGKQDRTFVVIISPVVQIPIELERQFVVVEHDLPGRDQIEQIARSIATEPGELPEGDDRGTVLDAASGLTQGRGRERLLIVVGQARADRPGNPVATQDRHAEEVGALTLHRGGESFADLGGLDALKGFTRRALASRKGTVRARGVLLLGVPGTGRSAFAKALANETGRPTLVLDVGSLMGSLVGQTEERTRQALRTVDAMAPAILFIDEIEKALAGVQSSGQTDSGVGARMFGKMLSWLSDHESDVFVVATSNDISKLPPEFSRAERWDGMFFIDLPGQHEKDAIWAMYVNRFGLNGNQPRPNDRDWTGAEVRSCCRLAALLDVPLVEAAQNVVPVAVTAAESVERLRNWASGHCLSAYRPGLHTRHSAGSSPSGRNVSRDPSVN